MGLSPFVGKEHQVHKFAGHPLIEFLYPRLLLIDMKIMGYGRVIRRLNSGSLMCLDRCPVDTIVDLSMDFENPTFCESEMAHRFLGILPRDAGWTFLIDASPETLRKRRPELAADSSLEARSSLYRNISRRLAIPLVDNEGELADAVDSVLKQIRGRIN